MQAVISALLSFSSAALQPFEVDVDEALFRDGFFLEIRPGVFKGLICRQKESHWLSTIWQL